MKRFFIRLGFYLLVTAIVLYAVFPFYYAIVTSFKTGPELFSVDYFPRALALG
jgi:trehalose/maltose transport system permease protein